MSKRGAARTGLETDQARSRLHSVRPPARFGQQPIAICPPGSPVLFRSSASVPERRRRRRARRALLPAQLKLSRSSARCHEARQASSRSRRGEPLARRLQVLLSLRRCALLSSSPPCSDELTTRPAGQAALAAHLAQLVTKLATIGVAPPPAVKACLYGDRPGPLVRSLLPLALSAEQHPLISSLMHAVHPGQHRERRPA